MLAVLVVVVAAVVCLGKALRRAGRPCLVEEEGRSTGFEEPCSCGFG
jgi:hypothetical protein